MKTSSISRMVAGLFLAMGLAACGGEANSGGALEQAEAANISGPLVCTPHRCDPDTLRCHDSAGQCFNVLPDQRIVAVDCNPSLPATRKLPCP